MMEPQEFRKMKTLHHPSEEDRGKPQIVPSGHRRRETLPIQPESDLLGPIPKALDFPDPCSPIDLQGLNKTSKGAPPRSSNLHHQQNRGHNASEQYISLSRAPDKTAGNCTGKFINDETSDQKLARCGVEVLASLPPSEHSRKRLSEPNPFRYEQEPIEGKVVYGGRNTVKALLENKTNYKKTTGVIYDHQKLIVNKWNQYIKGENCDEPLALGRGAFGHVLGSKDRVSQSSFVIKKINVEKMNPREVLMPMGLNNSGFVKMYGCIFQPAGVLEIFMEFGGFSLEKVADDEKSRKLLIERAIIDIGQQGYQALSVLRSQRIMHLDIKPQNLLLSWNYEKAQFHLKVCDFGAARYVGDSIIPSGWTPAYMAPEQCRYALSFHNNSLLGRWTDDERDVGPQADVYSFACSLLYLCYWQHCIPKLYPLCDDVLQLICKVANQPTALQNFIQKTWNRGMREVLMRALCGSPSTRITPMEAIQLLSGTHSTSVPESKTSSSRGIKRKSSDARSIESMDIQQCPPVPCKKHSPMEMDDGDDDDPEVEIIEIYRPSPTPQGALKPAGNLPFLGILLEES